MPGTPSLAAVLQVLDEFFDPEYAESWDAVGLVSGDPGDRIRSILVAVDPTEAVAAEAIRVGADLLLVHHPLFLQGVHAIPATTTGGRVVRSLIAGGCALHVAHTNADVATPGVSDALLAALGVPGQGRVLQPSAPLSLTGLVIHVPTSHAAGVLSAVTAAGAGRLGDYDGCSFAVEGTGTFRPLAGAAPFLGTVGKIEQVGESRLELVVAPRLVADVVLALRASHPYEEPSFWLWPLDVPSGRGLGRVGTLATALTLADFAAQVSGGLPRTAAGLRVSGDPTCEVRTVAAVGGSGLDLAHAAAAAGADVLVTADAKHHSALDAPLPVIDVGHWASEWPWCAQVAAALRAALGTTVLDPAGVEDSGDAVTVTVSTLVTDPWSMHLP